MGVEAMHSWEGKGWSYVYMGEKGVELCIYGRGNDGAMYLWELNG